MKLKMNSKKLPHCTWILDQTNLFQWKKNTMLKAVLKPELSEIVPKDKDIAILKRREI